MDYGGSLGSVMTICPSVFDLSQDAEIWGQETDFLKRLLVINRAKILVATQVSYQLREQHLCDKKMKMVAANKRRVASLYTMDVRMSVQEPFHHLMHRYLLVLWRDCLSLMTMLSGPHQYALYDTMRQSTQRILADPPNVHTRFLWGDRYRDSHALTVEEAIRLHIRLRESRQGIRDVRQSQASQESSATTVSRYNRR